MKHGLFVLDSFKEFSQSTSWIKDPVALKETNIKKNLIEGLHSVLFGNVDDDAHLLFK